MSAQLSLEFRTNRDLFSNHYLDDHLPDTEEWNDVSEDELQDAYERIQSLWERERDTAPQRNESQLEEKFIRPMFRELGIPFEVEESVERGQRRPDYGFFESEDAARGAYDRREGTGNFYDHAVAVADAKRWDRALDTRGKLEHDFENPSYQIHVYLQKTPAQWAVLTNGKKWRLYYGPTSHRLDSYYEIDLPTVLAEGDLEAFKYFYLFFRHEAFQPDASGDSFLDDVFEESNIFAQELGEDLQDNIYEAIKVLSEGFLQHSDNDLGAETLSTADLLPDGRASFEAARLDLVHDASLIYLYRLIFVLYAESEGRNLLDTDNDIYADDYSLNTLKQAVAEERDSPDPSYHDWQTDLWDRLDELFTLIDQGSTSKNIPKSDLHIPAYNGGLFRTDPDEDDSREARFLSRYKAGDEHLAEVIDLLTRSENGDGGGKIFVDYSSLDIRHLGSIYEGLLEYELNVAGEPLTLEDGEYVPADVGDDVAVETGDVYLTTDSGERKATGSYYTPEYVVEYIVENTLGPLIDDINEDLLAADPWGQEGGGQFAEEFAERVFELKVLDPAMGSGHFLTSATDYLAREIIDAQERQAEQQGVESIDQSRDINWARRQVAQRCIYGVDLNPLAVELSKVSLWLRTLAAEQPLAFLDHHLKTGNSLVGSDIEDVLANGDMDGDDGQLTLQQSFARTRQQALEHVMDRFQDLLAIENESLADIKEMEAAFEEVRDDPLYQHLLAMANVHTAEAFGLDVPGDAYERMAAALRDDSWDEIEGQDWFRSAQAMADEERFFHWELEFPVAFYGEDGAPRASEGFDGIIGNPPWAITGEEALKNYLSQTYEYQSGKPDLYRFFLERCLSLANGKFGMITPNTWFSIPSAEKLRSQVMGRQLLVRASLVPPGTFEGVDANMITFLMDLNNESTEIDVFDLDFEGAEFQYSLEYDDINDDDYQVDLRTDSDSLSLARKIEEKSQPMGEVTESTTGYQLYHNTIHTEEEIEAAVYHADSQINEDYVPEIRGGSIHRYFVDPTPDGYVDESAEFYRHLPEEFRKGSRVLIREITSADGIVSAFVEDELLYPKSVLGLRSDKFDEAFITVVINSSLTYFYFLVAGEKSAQELFPRISKSDLNSLPIPENQEIDLDQYSLQIDDINDRERSSNIVLQELGRISQAARIERFNLSLDLVNYLGNYSEGAALPDAGLFQPTDSNILDATTEEYDSLRIGDARTERDGNSVTISATARYKPENPEEYETDQWDYTETDFHEAFTLTDLTDEQATLVAEFVPVAVDEADGFAGFRDNATKTNSLVDRLKAITLPDPDDVADDLRRYLEVKERAEELDEKIAKTDQLIDEIVYDLYGLTEEEIEIVEESVGDG